MYLRDEISTDEAGCPSPSECDLHDLNHKDTFFKKNKLMGQVTQTSSAHRQRSLSSLIMMRRRWTFGTMVDGN